MDREDRPFYFSLPAITFTAIGLVLFAVMFLGLHGAACNMHVKAVETLWAHHPDARSKYVWSHNYCYIVGWPLRQLLP